MTTPTQTVSAADAASVDAIQEAVQDMVAVYVQPSASELVEKLEEQFGWRVRWNIEAALGDIVSNRKVSRHTRAYVSALLDSGDLAEAVHGGTAPSKEAHSHIDELVRRSAVYRSSAAFQEMLKFMARFRQYSPYNNLLVRTQNPSCGFFATAKHWAKKFDRHVKDGARPMVILAPMHPVLLVFALDDTEGPPVPKALLEFAVYRGEFQPKWLEQLMKNAAGHGIHTRFKTLSSTHAGSARNHGREPAHKMDVTIHDGLDPVSRFGVLCHEIAHILLGHLGADKDHWWPCRSNLTLHTIEIEAEAVAYIVTTRLGLEGPSARYVAGYLQSGPVPQSVSLDLIAKTAGRIERMATTEMPPRQPRRSE